MGQSNAIAYRARGSRPVLAVCDFKAVVVASWGRVPLCNGL